MNQLFGQLIARKNYLSELQLRLEEDLQKASDGKLRISNHRGISRYYQIREAKDTRGKYINKKNLGLAYELAQKDYAGRLLKEVKEEIEDIRLFLEKHGEDKLEKVFEDMNPYRKQLVKPLILSKDLLVSQWEAESYETNPYAPEDKVYSTKKDELVRSKSEVLLADMYNELGIPYRYEAALYLKSGKKKYPDFTLLKMATGELIYHEHLGLLDNDEYRKANLAKLDEYRRNGIFPGKNLIITYEAENSFLNIKEIRQMVKEILEVK
ncbi:MAG: hypothetical protein IJP31_01925 [Lachnospiraceae bacterium]|nr:hypothetical protein [Lachnospiraceae bacterium]